MALDFSLLGQGPQFGNVLQAYDAGRAQQKERATTNALALYATDPEGGIAAIRKVDPVLSMKLQDDYTERRTAAERKAVFRETDPTKRAALAQATGDPATITANNALVEQAAKLDDRQRALKKEASSAVGGFAFGLRQKVPYEQRKAAIQQNAAGLKEAGFSDDQIAKFDPTDAALDGVIAQMQTLDQAFKFADQEADNHRAQGDSEERIRHDKEMERLGGMNAGANVTRANRPSASGSNGLPSGYRLVSP